MSLSALLFDKLGSSACCHWTALDHILEFGDKMNLDLLQEGLIPLMSSPGFDIQTFSELYFLLHILACDSTTCLPTLNSTNILGNPNCHIALPQPKSAVGHFLLSFTLLDAAESVKIP